MLLALPLIHLLKNAPLHYLLCNEYKRLNGKNWKRFSQKDAHFDIGRWG